MPSLTSLLMFALLAVDPSIAALVAPAGGRVGFAALDLASGRVLGLNENEAFPTQSVFKLPVAIEALHQVDAGKLDLARVVALDATDARQGAATTITVPSRRTVGELLEAMIINSDNVACDKLLALLGGPGLVDARMRKLGMGDISVRYSELEMQTGNVDNHSTPTAMVALLAKIARRQTGLSPTSAYRLDDLLLRVATGQKRLRGELPPGTPVAHKTGTSQTANGKTNATNDVGLISLPDGHRIAIAVFVNASPADEPTRERTIAQLARFAFDRFSKPALRLPSR
jgi:beta-lactamase class A